MLSNHIILLFIGIVFIFLVICVWKDNIMNNTMNRYEKFISRNNDPANDGKMKYKYLTDINYGINIRNKYYINDDLKINNTRIRRHPYQKKNYNWSDRKYYYGKPANIGRERKYSNDLFNTYGIRM